MSTATLTGFALSPQQQRLWRLHGSGGAPGFVVQGSVEIVGALDRDRLWTALSQVVERHEVLRTTFPVLPGLLLPVQAVGETGEVERAEPLGGADLDALLVEARSASFDLAAGPLLRASLVESGAGLHHLLLTLPAVAADAASIRVLAAEIAAAYAGEDLAEPPFQYADAAEIFQEWLGPLEGEEGASYWRRQDLSGLSRSGLRKGDEISAAAPFSPRTTVARLAPGEAAALTRLAGQMGLPSAVVALAGWAAALGQTTGDEEVVIGVGFDGRTCAEFEAALGPYTRYLPVRCHIGPGSTLAEMADALQAVMAEAGSRQDFFPLEVADEAWPFGFDFEPASRLQPAAGGSVAFRARTVYAGLDRFDLRLSVHQEENGALRFELVHDPAACEATAAERLLTRAVRGIAALSAEPHREIADLDILSEEEREELLVRFNDTSREDRRPRTARELLTEPSRRSPEAPAVASGDLVRSHAELRRRVLRLAGHLAAQEVRPESRVAVCLERSPGNTWVLEALLAVLEVGGAYVPLDPGYPAERLSFLLEDSGASIVLTEERLLPRLSVPDRARVLCMDQLEDDLPAAAPGFTAPPLDAENLAYVIYTSGSTGRPKGVMVPHRGLASYLLWATEAYRAAEGNGAPVHSAVGFDLTVTSLFVPLAAGRSIELLPEEQGASALAATLRKGRDFSLVKLTPAHLDVLRQVLTPEEVGGCAGALVIGGEALRAESLALFREGAPGTRLINEYGPTEATVGCCVYEVRPEDPATGTVPIGRPIAGIRLYVMGPRSRPVPAGAPGELWIGGDGLARGYLGRPELTAERFVPDPFGPPGERLYRTGDRVRLRSDGQLEFLGRLDGQVKIRGHRIELGEVEAALASHPAVGEVAVASRGEGSERRLVAWFAPRGETAPTAEELRTFLGRQLPEPMVPSAFVALDRLPLTAHGKVDRQALPEPREADLWEAPYAPPRNLTEEVLAEIFARVLGIERVGIDDSFFSLGGDSIRSLQVLALTQKRGLVLTLQDLFRHPTIRDLSESVRLDGATVGPEPPPPPFSLVSVVDRERLDPGLEDAYPLTRLQAGMLYHSELSPESAVYHDLHSARLRGRYDAELLATAIEQVVRRHPLLRTSFDLAGFSEPLQLVHRQVELPLTTDDLRHLSVEEGRRIALAWLDQEALQPFDWSRAPLARFQIHLFGDGSFQFTLSFHHSIFDGWSAASLLTELFRRYVFLLGDAASPEESPPSATLRELVHLERAALASAEAREFWRRHLDGSSLLRLPNSRPETAERRAGLLSNPLPPDLSDGLKGVARSLSLPLKSVLMAVHFRVLGLLAGQTDVVSGVVSNGRPERPDSEQAIGLFLNTLPLRMVLPGGSWSDLAHAAFELERDSLPFRRVPLSELQRMEGGRPLFEIAFNFLHFHVYDSVSQLTGLEVVSREGYEETNFSLITHFQLSGSARHIVLDLSYQMAEHGRVEMEEVARRYLVSLEAVAADPGAPYDSLTLFTEGERAQLLAWNETARPMRLPLLVHEIFEVQAERTPEAPAAEMDGERLTYRELDRRAARLARSLRAAGVGSDDPVGMCLERSLAVPVAILGILKAGGAYLPLDPAYPAERLTAMADDARLRWLVCDESTLGRLPAGLGAERRLVLLGPAGEMDGDEADGAAFDAGPVDPGHLAYVLYTSGSTGRPKGVAMPHAPLANLIDWQIAATTAPGPRRTAQFSALSFDASFHEMFTTWAQGGTLVLLSEAVRRDAGSLLQLLTERSIEQLFLPFVALQQLADEAAASGVLPTALREVITAGEQLQATAAVRELFRQLPGCRLVNAYGPTETHVVTAFTLPESPDAWPTLPPIGPPIANLQVRVLDASLQPVLPGAPGELYFGGVGLARGYLGRPEITAERFLPDPQATEPGARVYRTGDLGRYRSDGGPDGAIEFLGRTDHQVKVRGFRVEPGEIEAALALHPEVREAAVVVREVSGPGDRRLVGYVVPRGRSAAEAGDALAAELRAFLAGRLPEHMVPWALVLLDAFPLTPSGKLDRRHLPAPGPVRRSAEGFAPPRGPVEEIVAGVWAEVLGSGPVGIHESFFELGGHSLLATRVMSRVRAAFGIDLPLRALFDAPTVAGLGVAVERALRTGAAPVPPLVPVPRGGDLPLSFAQQRLWFIDRLRPGHLAYSLPAALRLTGVLKPQALAESFHELVARHEVLRTTFVLHDGEPLQRIAPPADVSVPLLDLGALPREAAEAEVHRLATDEACRPFDLARGPLLRVALARLGEQEHALLLNLHHIIADGWSLGVLTQEIGELYAARAAGFPSPLPPLPVQYADFAVWQRSWLRGEVLEAEVRHWRERLAGAPAALDLPTDRPRPAVPSGRGGSCGMMLPPEIAESLTALGRRRSATLFMILLAAWKTLLYRLSGQDDLVVGTPVANRQRTEIEGLIGFFVNTLALRTRVLRGATGLELLDQVRETALAAFSHQDLPFEKLVEELLPVRDTSRNPLFQVALGSQTFPIPTLRSSGLEIRPIGFEQGAAKLDLTLHVAEGPRGLSAGVEYSADLFDAATAGRLLGHLRSLLEAFLADPGSRLEDLPLLTPAEHRQILEEWAAGAPGTPSGGGVHRLFAALAEQDPEAVAVVAESGRRTRGELVRRAAGLARRLTAAGVGLETRVGLCVERSPALVESVLAILAAGGAWVPLDPSLPRERLAYLLEDSGARVVVATAATQPILAELGTRVEILDPEDGTSEDVSADCWTAAIPESLAYVIYTSGSTGRPKGVQIPHAGLANLAAAMAAVFEIGPGDRMLQVAPTGFDASVLEILTALLSGAELHLASAEALLPGLTLAALLRDRRITHALLTPSALASLPPAELPDLRGLAVGGEACPPELARRWSAGGRRIINAYGPTEVTVCTAALPVSGQEGPRLPLGPPVPGALARVLDSGGGLLPAGIPGELCLGGIGLARGYLGRPDLTAGRFVPDPFGEPGTRLYRTGDLARWLPDGTLDFLGRVDHQLKIRGVRTEPGEVEAALASHPGVREAAVAAWGEGADRHLAAYVVPADGHAPEPAELREHLRHLLPGPLVPTAWVTLPALPLNANGKLDRNALPAPGPRLVAAAAVYEEPRTAAEREIAGIWSDLLGAERVGIHDNFFDLGGHSLLMVRVQSRLWSQLEREITMVDLFSHPTVASLAGLLTDAGGGAPAPVRSAAQEERMAGSKERLRRLRQGSDRRAR